MIDPEGEENIMSSADKDSVVNENAFVSDDSSASVTLKCRDRADDEALTEHSETSMHATCNGRDWPMAAADGQSTDQPPQRSDGDSSVGQTQPTTDGKFSADANEKRTGDDTLPDHAPARVVISAKYAARRGSPCETFAIPDDSSYRACLARIRERLAGKKIWASMDETTDPRDDGETAGHVVVGALSPDGPGDAYLLASGVLRDGDPEAAARLFRAAVRALWPDGGAELSLLVSGLRPATAGPAETTAGWPAVGADTVLVSCVARRLHEAAERVRAQCPSTDALVSMARRAFARDPTRLSEMRARWPDAPPPPPALDPSAQPRAGPSCAWIESASYLNEHLAAVRGVLADRPDRRESWPAWQAGRLTVDPHTEPALAYVDLNYGFLPAAVAQVRARGVPLTRAVDATRRAADRLAEVPGLLGAAVHRRYADSLRDDRGFCVLADVADVMAGRRVTMDGLPTRLSGNDVKHYKYAPVAAVDVRAAFPRHEVVFSRRNRLRYGGRDLNRLLVVQCNGFADGGTAGPGAAT